MLLRCLWQKHILEASPPNKELGLLRVSPLFTTNESEPLGRSFQFSLSQLLHLLNERDRLDRLRGPSGSKNGWFGVILLQFRSYNWLQIFSYPLREAVTPSENTSEHDIWWGVVPASTTTVATWGRRHTVIPWVVNTLVCTWMFAYLQGSH